MKKTTMTQLIDEIKGMKSLLNNQESRVAECMTVITDRATELLETEREQIEEAFIDGCKVGVDFEKSQVQLILCEWPNSEKYYKDTYR